jgi:hypothetical protein
MQDTETSTPTTSDYDPLATAHLPFEQRGRSEPEEYVEIDTDGVEDVTHEAAREREYEEVRHEPEPETAETQEKVSDDVDEYGNEAPKDNDIIRERLARQAESLQKKFDAQLAAKIAKVRAEIQQSPQNGFEYDPDASGDWQQQLEHFVKQTVTNMQTEGQRQQQAQQEARAHAEFEFKFHDGMSKFGDFVDVVGSQPITDAMTLATRGMKDPAAFLYAASKRNPEELKRISAIPDQYVQMTEMGKLEERMRKSAPASKAPRPLGKTTSDVSTPHKTEKKKSLDEMLRDSDAARIDRLRQFKNR